jgi:hypothetical protein
MRTAPSPREGGSMRSLWRMLALQWLGGEGSEALARDSDVLDMLTGEHKRAIDAFDIQRIAGISHQAMMSSSVDPCPNPEIASQEARPTQSPDRDPS